MGFFKFKERLNFIQYCIFNISESGIKEKPLKIRNLICLFLKFFLIGTYRTIIGGKTVRLLKKTGFHSKKVKP
jgi:hypothetical protein